MNHAADHRTQATDTLRDLYAPSSTNSARSRKSSREELRSEHPFVDRLVKYGVRLGGKRLRPALVLLSAKACRPAAARPLRPGGRRRNDPHRHADPRRRAGRSHHAPPPGHGQLPLEQRDQRPAGRLPASPGRICLASSWMARSPAGPSARPAAPCARANCARSPAAATSTWPSRSTWRSSPTRRPP